MADPASLLPAGVELPREHRWPVLLRAGALVLRPIARREDFAWDVLRAANYLWTHEWDPTVPPEGEALPLTFVKWLRHTEGLAKRGEMLPWGLAFDPDWPQNPRPDQRTRLIGQVTVSSIIRGSARSATIGYWIDQQHAGRGLTPAGVALACDYCWQVLRLHRIEICVRPENDRSLRVVTKLGFREEGLRPRFLHINGEWRDHRVFALNREEAPEGLLNRLLAGGPLPGAPPDVRPGS